jgi:hypothetical protein
MSSNPFPPPAQSYPAGWYPDGQGATRYWDGSQWTQHTAPQPGGAPAARPAGVTRSPLFVAAMAAAALAAIGSFGPWATFGSLSQSGTNGGDGWIVIGCVAIGAGMLAVSATRGGKAGYIVAIVLGLIAALVGFIDFSDVGDTSLDVGWGLFAVLAGSIALAALSIALLSRRGRPG